ncbi:MAG: ammonium transporter, partial [Desulfovibrio sp.]|nr:ammonium transporter [Desulfovibrio sp.]
MNAADTAFVLICAALVLFMTPGLALFYGGMVRAKNVLGTVMHSMVIVGVASLVWAVIGYTLSFGSDVGGIIGGLDFFGLNGVGMEAKEGVPNIPHLAFMVFQCMFAVITPALITGAFAERIKFTGFLLFTVLWLIFVYSPMCHWVWGGGWLAGLGALDFAGGAVVHMSSAASALACAIYLGKRAGYGKQAFIPHNLPLTVLGAAILWFGWFGFNAGSALAANGLAASAFTTTQVAAGAGLLGWIIAEWMKYGKPTMLGAISGGIAGLVAITPAAGFVTPLSAVFIGLVGGALCYFGVAVLKAKLGYDDSLDAFGIHGIGGTWGALATGIWTTTTVNSAGKDGLFYTGAFDVVTNQMIAVVATYVIAAVA